MNPHSAFDLHVTAQALMVTPHGNWPMTACVLYTVQDPLAITVYIDPCEQPMQPIEWTFARDLLLDALGQPGRRIGQGDVRATYMLADDFLVLELATVDRTEHVPISIEAEPVESVLARSLLLVPAEQVEVYVDEMIAHILDPE